MMGMLKGQKEAERYKQGLPLTAKQSIKAHCYMCNGEGDGSGEDCQDHTCPLCPWFKKWVKMRPRSCSKGQVGSSVA